MALSIILLLIGFVLLIKGADWMVDGSSSVARKLSISDLVIGLTIVAFGTSAPELIVGILAAINGNTEVAIGNILGSTIANTLLILGVAASITPLMVKKNTVWKEIPLAFLAVFLVAVFTNDVLIDNIGSSFITRSDGIVLLCFFIVFLYYTFGMASDSSDNEPEEDTAITEQPWGKSIVLIVVGIVGLAFGGHLVVTEAVSLALLWGVSESLVALTIVAVGTSLPELVTSAVAAKKGNTDIALGNVFGSNIFNIFWILGVTSLIQPLPFDSALNVDVAVAGLAMGGVFLALFVGKRHQLERWQGVLGVVCYFIYIGYLIWRG